jgi:hypothetical protein
LLGEVNRLIHVGIRAASGKKLNNLEDDHFVFEKGAVSEFVAHMKETKAGHRAEQDAAAKVSSLSNLPQTSLASAESECRVCNGAVD